MTPTLVLVPGVRLSAAELSAAKLDGDVVPLDAVYAPADAAETPTLRAAALAGLVAGTVAVTRLAAAWLYGAVDEPPARVCVQRAVPRRITHVLDPRLDYRDALLPEADAVLIGGVRVTTPARTLGDLARDRQPVSTAAARQLIAHGDVTAAAGLAVVRAAGAVPGKRAALRVLREWCRADQPEVTR